MLSRHLKNIILLGFFVGITQVLITLELSSEISLGCAFVLFLAFFCHEKIIKFSFWEGMLLPVAMVAGFVAVLVTLEAVYGSQKEIIRPLAAIAIIPMAGFYLYRLVSGKRSPGKASQES